MPKKSDARTIYGYSDNDPQIKRLLFEAFAFFIIAITDVAFILP